MRHPWLKLIIMIVISETAGILGSFFTIAAIPGWYAGLVKPPLNPPNWIFAPVWNTLYLLMAVAAFLVWRKGRSREDIREALFAFSVQLFLNALWSIIFFGVQSPLWAFIELILMWLAIFWTIKLFWKISKTAAYLLLPYLLWITFAGYLNFAIWLLNR